MDAADEYSKLSTLCGLSPHTLRYYEKIGLLLHVARKANGHRDYTEKDLAWIEFLKRLKETGMPIAEIKRFARLRSEGDRTLHERQQMLESHRQNVLAELERIHTNLTKISSKIVFYENLSADQNRLDLELTLSRKVIIRMAMAIPTQP